LVQKFEQILRRIFDNQTFTLLNALLNKIFDFLLPAAKDLTGQFCPQGQNYLTGCKNL